MQLPLEEGSEVRGVLFVGDKRHFPQLQQAVKWTLIYFTCPS